MCILISFLDTRVLLKKDTMHALDKKPESYSNQTFKGIVCFFYVDFINKLFIVYRLKIII